MLLMTQTTNHRRGVQCVISTIPISNVAIKIMDGLCVFVYPQHCNNNEIKSTLHQRLQLWSLQAPCVGASQVVTPHPHLARLPDSQAKPMSFFFSAFSESSHHKDRVYSEVCDNSLEHSASFSDIWLGMWSLTGKEVTVLRHSCSSRSNQNANAESWSL